MGITDTTKLPQCDLIMMYMKDHGSITPLDALREFGCMRLAARIADLRERGHRIESIPESNTNRYGNKIRYSRYYLDET